MKKEMIENTNEKNKRKKKLIQKIYIYLLQKIKKEKKLTIMEKNMQ